jgi:alpha-ketoglutarate-dependent 2,4-dichlorophenoxyacetate dioxygenase
LNELSVCHSRLPVPNLHHLRIARRRAEFGRVWRVHDLVIWDDRCTMHRGSEFDDLRFKRDMQRATASDIANSCEQEGLAVAAA